MSIDTSEKYKYKRIGLASLLLDTVIKEIKTDLISDILSMITIPMYEKRGFKVYTLGEGYKMVVYTR